MAPEIPLPAHLMVGGFLLLTSVFLLFHCSSFARRRKQRQVRHSVPSGTGSDVTPERKRKHGGGGKRGGKGVGGEEITLPVIAIIVTPPSPMVTPRGQDSIGSTGDLLQREDSPPSDDVSDDEPPLCPPSPPKERRLVASATSLGAIRDVQLMTEEEEAMTSPRDSDDDTRGDEEDFVMTRPRLSSMEPGAQREDFHIVTIATTGQSREVAEDGEGGSQCSEGQSRT